MKQSEEIWKPVTICDGIYADCYEVSNLGRVRSLDKITLDGRHIKGKILSPGLTTKGYYFVQLSHDNNLKHAEIHRIVALAFLPNPNNYICVNHKDENTLNNVANNLEWCTLKYNSNYGTNISRRVQKESKRIVAVNINTGEETEYSSLSECQRCGGFNSGGIHKVMLGKQPSHKGYIFYYPDEPDWASNHKKNILYGAIYAISITDGSRLDFKSMEETAKSGFIPPSVSKALKRENNIYKGYK